MSKQNEETPKQLIDLEELSRLCSLCCIKTSGWLIVGNYAIVFSF